VTRCALDAVDRLYTAAESRTLDRVAIDIHGIPGIVLMKRAGRAVFDTVTDHWPDARSLTIVAGRGNNAGDGYIVAGLALGRGLAVQLVQLGAPARLGGDAARARDWAVAAGVEIEVVDENAPTFEIGGDVIVDALLGTGVSGEVRGGFGRAIDAINASGRPIIAVDLPSGLCADTGRILGTAVRAAVTVTFIGVKRGLVTGDGPDCTGAVVFDDLAVPTAVGAAVPGIEALHWDRLAPGLPRRPVTAHKRVSGHLLVIGGDLGMGGAVLLAAEAALRAGAGLVSVLTRPEHVAALLARRPEIMVRGFGDGPHEDPVAVDTLLGRATALAVGPGLGRSDWSQALLGRALATSLPIVLDADALNLIGTTGARPAGASVVTPHPGEAGRLLGLSTEAIQADRFAAARRLVQRLNAAVVLKGAGTVVDDGSHVGVCLHGNEGMASAGMGDVLTGVIGSLLAQGLQPAAAARLGTCLHSRAGDDAAVTGGLRGLIATDVIEALRGLTNDRRG